MRREGGQRARERDLAVPAREHPLEHGKCRIERTDEIRLDLDDRHVEQLDTAILKRARQNARIGNEQVDRRAAVEPEQPLADGLAVAHIGHAGFHGRTLVAAGLRRLLQALRVAPYKRQRAARRGIMLRERSADPARRTGDGNDRGRFRHQDVRLFRLSAS